MKGTTTERNTYLEESRKKRENALIGKFVITQNSRFNKGQKMYLQDENLAKGQGHSNMHWTLYLANAKGFENEYVARAIARRFKYNNVEVLEIH